MYILPEPEKKEVTEGFFQISCHTEIILPQASAEESASVAAAAEQLKETIRRSAGYELSVRRCGKKETGKSQILLHYGEEKTGSGAQGYRLTVAPEEICIEGNGAAGVFYGVQTLRQIAVQSGAEIPCMMMEDKPALANRGYYFDATRGRIPRLDALKKMADTLSYYKINQMQLYIEHSFLFPSKSELWRDDTPITAEDIM